MKATAKDLRYKTREILAAVERGEEVLITYRGKKKARIVPIVDKNEKPGAKEKSLFGIWHDHDMVSDVTAYLDGIRGGRFGTR